MNFLLHFLNKNTQFMRLVGFYFFLLSHCFNAWSEPIYAIVFDCDGVLVNTEQKKFEAWKAALTAFSIDYLAKDYAKMVGFDNKAILESIKTIYHLDLPISIINEKEKVYQSLQIQGVPVIEKGVEAVRFFALKKGQNFKLALASSASRKEIAANLSQIGLSDVFDLIISGFDDLSEVKDPEGTNKPKPYIYQKAAKLLNLPAENIVVFEDSAAGCQAAVDANMRVVAVVNQWTFHQTFNKVMAIWNEFPNGVGLENWFTENSK